MNRSAFRLPWNPVCWLVICILLAAVVFKITYSTRILASEGLLSTRPLLFAVIGLEAGLIAFLLISDARIARIATLLAFGSFTLASLYAIMTEQNCHCFAMVVGPRTSLAIDIVVLVLAAASRPVGGDSSKPHRLAGAVFKATAAGLIAALLALGVQQVTLRSGNLDVLLAEKLLHRRWPLDEQWHPELRELSRGQWFVLIVARDCERCHELLREHFADPSSRPQQMRSIVFISGDSEWPFQLDRISLNEDPAGTISWPEGEPFVATPAVFVLRDGLITQAADGRQSFPMVATLLAEQ